MTFPMSPQDALEAFRADFEVGGPPDVQIADFRGDAPGTIVSLTQAFVQSI